MTITVDAPLTTTTPAPARGSSSRHREDYSEPGDSEKFAHYVNKNKAMEAYVYGSPLQALCGKFWVPTRAPDKFPVCAECKDLYDQAPETPQEAGEPQ